MKKFILLFIVSLTVMMASIVNAQQGLYISFPDNNYTATTEKISLIGSAPPDGQVLINNQVIPRSKKGYFAYQITLNLGENNIIVKYEKQEKIIKIIRKNTVNVAPKDDFASDSLTPGQDVARLPNELMCFSAIAPTNAQVSVRIAEKTIPLTKEEETVSLPPNLSALTQTNEPIATTGIGKYLGCTALAMARDYNYPLFQLAISDINGQKITKSVPGKGKIKILSPDKLEIAEVKENNGIARTGPSTDYSRLTPLPKGTKASITGKEGDWLRLDYGGWINSKEVKIYPPSVPPQTIIRSIIAKQVEDATEIFFPLQVPVPMIAQQGENQLVLTLYNTTAQTDIIKLNPDPIINRIDWKQLAPGMVQYTLTLKGQQQWGYKVEYRGKNLVLIVRHSPLKNRVNKQTLEGIKILIDPGHGGKEPGASGPTGYLE
ncbi:MAG TPA: SH3 domain-containing protein, partial [Allocoleopsis sp.]